LWLIEKSDSAGLAVAAWLSAGSSRLGRADFLGDLCDCALGESFLERLLRPGEDLGERTLDLAPHTATLVGLLWMHSESRCRLDSAVHFPERNLSRAPGDARSGASPLLGRNQPRPLELRQDAADHYGIGIHAAGQGLRRDSTGAVPGEDRKDMHRKSEATTGHFYAAV
jgi:hypothetical protein